jgi:nitroreductase
MNEVIEALLQRRSIRKYLEQAVPEEYLDIILQTALYAPSGGNHHYTRFIVVKNPLIMTELNRIVKDEFSAMVTEEGKYQNKTIIKAKKDDYNFMFHAPVLIIAVSPKSHGNSMADSALALGNIQIAAYSLKLGSCWVNQLHWLTESESLRNYMYQLGMLESENIYGGVVLGYPALPLHSPAKRKEGRIIFAE